jgi:hypothetical protein
MKLKNILKRIQCKIAICCNSKCSLNDTDKDGIPDQIVIENEEDSENKYKFVVEV